MFMRLGRLFRTVGRDLLVLWHVCRHPGTPLYLKLLAALIGLYILSPIDVVPDWLALLGFTDDIALLALAVPLLLKLVPHDTLMQARNEAQAFLGRRRFGKV